MKQTTPALNAREKANAREDSPKDQEQQHEKL